MTTHNSCACVDSKESVRIKILRLAKKSKTEAMADAPKQPIKIYGNDALSTRVAEFQKKATEHKEKQKTNPFSESHGSPHHPVWDKSDPRYGRPPEGSKTEKRGLQAGKHISGEVVLLCDMIYQYGHLLPDERVIISFGELFEIYTRISNKVVGILLRARKHGFVDFEGEMLFQRRDDHVLITLTCPIKELHEMLGIKGPPPKRMVEEADNEDDDMLLITEAMAGALKKPIKICRNDALSTFSESHGPSHHQVWDKSDPRYGQPPVGSKTEKRGLQAGEHISGEVQSLCDMIYQYGDLLPDGRVTISFGKLFEMYVRISNKVVGILLRARKHGFVDFEGEMLFQRRDDHVLITLTSPIEKLHEIFGVKGPLPKRMAEGADDDDDIDDILFMFMY